MGNGFVDEVFGEPTGCCGDSRGEPLGAAKQCQ